MKIFLKNKERPNQMIFFDDEKLTRLEIYNPEISFEKYDFKDDFDFNINYALKNNYIPTTRKEFNDSFIEVVKELNQIVKEL